MDSRSNHTPVYSVYSYIGLPPPVEEWGWCRCRGSNAFSRLKFLGKKNRYTSARALHPRILFSKRILFSPWLNSIFTGIVLEEKLLTILGLALGIVQKKSLLFLNSICSRFFFVIRFCLFFEFDFLTPFEFDFVVCFRILFYGFFFFSGFDFADCFLDSILRIVLEFFFTLSSSSFPGFFGIRSNTRLLFWKMVWLMQSFIDNLV